MAWTTFAVVIFSTVSSAIGAFGGWLLSGSSKTENINTEGAIQTKVIVNEQSNIVTYIVIAIAIFEFFIVTAGIYLCIKFKKLKRNRRSNETTTTIEYNPRFDSV